MELTAAPLQAVKHAAAAGENTAIDSRVTAAEALGVTPDLMTCAKGLTNGAVPMGAVPAAMAPADWGAFMGGCPPAVG